MSAAADELRALDDDALATRLDEAREALFNLRFQHSSGALEPVRQMGLRRKEIARIMTIQRERELEHG